MQLLARKTLFSLPIGLAAVLLFAATSRPEWQVMDSVQTPLQPDIESVEIDLLLTVQGLDTIEDREDGQSLLSVYAAAASQERGASADNTSADDMAPIQSMALIRIEAADGTELVAFTDDSVELYEIFDDCVDSCEVRVTAEVIVDQPIDLHFDAAVRGFDGTSAPQGLQVQIEIVQP